MSALQVVPAGSRREHREFLDFPYRHYRADRYWVAPLRLVQKELFDTARHPFWGHADLECFLAPNASGTLGRIAAIVDRNYNEFHQEQAGFFGFLETVNDLEVARALLEAARDWLRARGGLRRSRDLYAYYLDRQIVNTAKLLPPSFSWVTRRLPLRTGG